VSYVSNTYVWESDYLEVSNKLWYLYCKLLPEIIVLNEEQQDKLYCMLGEIIKQKRQEKKLNQEDLAKQVALSRVSIVNIEKGIQKVQIHTLLEIASFLNFSIDELIPFAVNRTEISTKTYEKNIYKESLQLNNQQFGMSLFEDFIKLSQKKNALNNGTKD
jgi:transcriptional regulator with XRE-family HTH domain